MRIETTINNGLPVIVEAEVETDLDDIHMRRLLDTLIVRFRNGDPYHFTSFEDEDRIVNELIEAQEDQWAREGVRS